MNVVVAPDKLHICRQEAALRMSAFLANHVAPRLIGRAVVAGNQTARRNRGGSRLRRRSARPIRERASSARRRRRLNHLAEPPSLWRPVWRQNRRPSQLCQLGRVVGCAGVGFGRQFLAGLEPISQSPGPLVDPKIVHLDTALTINDLESALAVSRRGLVEAEERR